MSQAATFSHDSAGIPISRSTAKAISRPILGRTPRSIWPTYWPVHPKSCPIAACESPRRMRSTRNVSPGVSLISMNETLREEFFPVKSLAQLSFTNPSNESIEA